ncbi:hypothetical protein [Flavobacterium channae]|uniref:hypothetical protein n=1 Tax=Flavobacterium channae TaxID=2897181 RepID=UPI001E396D2F|nr:hypothetical protein [Flavobacterium channae]UGS22586.1 hypothetical protein LOS89_07305 [Flavobacterium channae]
MLTNKEIKEQLNIELDRAISEFKELNKTGNLISGFENFLNFNFDSYKENLKKEIKTNLKSYWTNVDNGINQDEKLDAILFEHYIPDTIDLEANAYGIIDWEEKNVEYVEVDMGFGYDFAEEFEQIEGITLSFFDPYVASFEIDETGELSNCYRLKGMIAIHEVFYELHKENAFDCLNKKEDFYILVGEHDSYCYAVLAI